MGFAAERRRPVDDGSAQLAVGHRRLRDRVVSNLCCLSRYGQYAPLAVIRGLPGQVNSTLLTFRLVPGTDGMRT
jgi:hypothetical protein